MFSRKCLRFYLDIVQEGLIFSNHFKKIKLIWTKISESSPLVVTEEENLHGQVLDILYNLILAYVIISSAIERFIYRYKALAFALDDHILSISSLMSLSGSLTCFNRIWTTMELYVMEKLDISGSVYILTRTCTPYIQQSGFCIITEVKRKVSLPEKKSRTKQRTWSFGPSTVNSVTV